MGGVLLLWLFLFAGAVELSLGISHEIHLLRPQLGSNGHHVPGLSCLSWRLDYVGHYMLGHQNRKDSRAVVYEALTYAQSLKLAGDGKDIWVFDVDETSLSNLPYYAKHGFGYLNLGKAPALPESLKLYKKLLSLRIKAVFITGRPEAQRNVTAANLRNVGYHTWERLILKGSSTGIAIVYKSNERKKLEKSGYRTIANIGDQWSDILGTNIGNWTFKLPNPMWW
ncbi:hypothetical protein PVL29_011339 [Vitis rotundifolia]|uniref:Acid phosphatase n=1 Tax=Vitis rotundifolia TaxID=103349 RepID=A0AA38ZN92_VITRO|nr:hypothetical protein PVL29_011339 [Vitis rotundifolia]